MPVVVVHFQDGVWQLQLFFFSAAILEMYHNYRYSLRESTKAGIGHCDDDSDYGGDNDFHDSIKNNDRCKDDVGDDNDVGDDDDDYDNDYNEGDDGDDGNCYDCGDNDVNDSVKPMRC